MIIHFSAAVELFAKFLKFLNNDTLIKDSPISIKVLTGAVSDFKAEIFDILSVFFDFYSTGKINITAERMKYDISDIFCACVVSVSCI